MVMTSRFVSSIVVVCHGLAIRGILSEKPLNDETLGPKLWVFDGFNILLLDAETKAFKAIVLTRNFLQLHDRHHLRFISRSHVVGGNTYVDVPDIKAPCQVGTLHNRRPWDTFFPTTMSLGLLVLLGALFWREKED